MVDTRIVVCNNCNLTVSLDVAKTVTFQQKLYLKKGFPRIKVQCECNHCDSTDVEFVNVGEVDLLSIGVGEFSSMSREGRLAHLKKRSQDHAKRVIHPYKHAINEDFKKQIEGR